MSKKGEIKELAESMSLLTECSHCKQKININAPFCQYCGTKQIKLNNKKDVYCIHCGSKIDINSKFCYQCGKSQNALETKKTAETTKKKKETNIEDIKLKCKKCSSENVSVQIVKEKISGGCFIWIIAVIALLVNIILGIFLLLLAILMSLVKNEVTTKVCVCQKCGHSWEIR